LVGTFVWNTHLHSNSAVHTSQRRILKISRVLPTQGLSLLAVPAAGVLVSFGGYNGKYHQDVHLFRPGEVNAPRAMQSGIPCRMSRCAQTVLRPHLNSNATDFDWQPCRKNTP